MAGNAPKLLPYHVVESNPKLKPYDDVKTFQTEPYETTGGRA